MTSEKLAADMIHGFFDMGPASAGARAAIAESCRLLADLLHASR